MKAWIQVLKKNFEKIICHLLFYLMAFMTTNVFGQDSQSIVTPEERAEALEVLRDLIGELQSAQKTEDGQHYNLSLADSPVLATVGLTIFGKEQGVGRPTGLQAQLKATQLQNEEIRKKLEASQKARAILEQQQTPSQQAWPANENAELNHRYIFDHTPNGYALEGFTNRERIRIFSFLNVWKNLFARILDDLPTEKNIFMTYQVQKSGLYSYIVMDPQRSFLNIKNPLTSDFHSTSIHDLINGQPVALGHPWPTGLTGQMMTERFQKEFRQLSKDIQSGRNHITNRFSQGLRNGLKRGLRGAIRFGIFAGITYFLFLSDILEEPRSALLRETAIFLNLPADIFENTLDELNSFFDELTANQHGNNDFNF